ncbi:MAG: Xaa-Pro peptidase family protein [Solirubrobacteraceae bacterium]
MSRADRVQARFEAVDALLVTDLVNLRYLTGFTGTNGFAVLAPGLRRFVTDFRYVERAAAEVEGFDRERAPQEFLSALGDGWPADIRRLGFEDHKLSVRQHAKLRDVVPARIELVAAGGLVERERAVKEPAELEAIAVAAGLADEALTSVLSGGLVGRTEREVALALEDAVRAGGGEPAFGTIVAAGVNGAAPHATPDDTPIAAGTLVTIDFGARLAGYNSDCTRTYAAGAVGEDLVAIYELVREAQAAALAAVRPGPEGHEIDTVARELIAAAGHAEHFGHGLGHGLGLEVHEAPRLSTTGTDALAVGNVVTVEPGVYVPGLGGVRIEDLVVLTDDGARVLSGHAKDLAVLD